MRHFTFIGSPPPRRLPLSPLIVWLAFLSFPGDGLGSPFFAGCRFNLSRCGTVLPCPLPGTPPVFKRNSDVFGAASPAFTSRLPRFRMRGVSFLRVFFICACRETKTRSTGFLQYSDPIRTLDFPLRPLSPTHLTHNTPLFQQCSTEVITRKPYQGSFDAFGVMISFGSQKILT